MDRQVIKLHTIEQWFQTDQSTRSVVLQNIKLKDRLHHYLMKKLEEVKSTDPRWRKCRYCIDGHCHSCDSEYPGWVAEEPRRAGIHPSQLAGQCLLKIYNEMIGVEAKERITPRVQLVFDLGHAVHHMFQKYGNDGAWGALYKKESTISSDIQPLAAKLLIEGSADAENILVIDNIPDCPYIYEVGLVHEYKTIKGANFSKLTRPKPEHKIQATVYSAILNRPVVVFLYINKDDSNLADFPVAFDPDVWKAVETKTLVLIDHFNRKSTPPGNAGYHCQECGYAYSCDAYKEAVNQRSLRNT